MALQLRRFARLAFAELEQRLNPGFLAPVAWATPPTPINVTFADLNRDGRPDMVFTNPDVVVSGQGGNNLDLYLGTGTGLSAASPVTVGAPQTALVVADFNRDGNPDVATTLTNNTLVMVRGTGLGLGSADPGVGIPAGPIGITAADFNGDGRMDVVVAGSSAGQMAVGLNNTAGNRSEERRVGKGGR